MDRKNLILAIIGVLLSALILYYLGYFESLLRLFGDVEYIRELVEPYETFGVFILLGLQLINIIVAPIPGQALGVAYGLIYGVWWGTLFGMIGTTVGTAIAVLIGKKYGRSFVKSLIGEERFRKYEEVTDSTDVYPFMILIILPVIPDDAIAYLAGLTTIDTRRLIVYLSLARIPGMVSLTWFGDGIATANYLHLGFISAVVIVVSVLVVWKRKEIIERYS